MSLTLNSNTQKASSAYAQIKANEAIQRSRFSHTSVQTEGAVYVSNKPRPSLDATSDDWVQITTPVETDANIYHIPMPVLWVAASDEAWICSYVSGDL